MSGQPEAAAFPNIWGGAGEDIATVGGNSVAGEPGVDASSTEGPSPVDIDSPEAQSAPVDVEAEAQAGSEQTAKADASEGEVEYIDLTDETGRKRLKIDWNNRDAIKKAISMAAGARKWQAERDQLKAKLEAQETSSKDVKEAWDAVSNAYETQGIEGLVDLLAAEQGAYQKWLSSQLQRELAKRDASPDELERIQLKERLDKMERERAVEAKRLKDREEAVAKERAAAEEAQLQSIVNPAFDKVRFAGTLGNEQLEDRLDRTVWSEAIDILSSIEEQQGKQAVTPAVTRKVFQEVAESLRGALQVKAREEAAAASETRKAQAATKVAAKAQTVQGSRQTDSESFKKNIADGNWSAALASMLSGRVK